MFNPYKTKFPIAIDISPVSIKIIQLEQGKEPLPHVRAYSQIPVPKGVIVEDSILDSQTLAYVVRQGLDRPKFGSFTGGRVVASLPEAKSFVRVIHLPHMSDNEIDQTIPFEAESYIPVPVDQVYLDWQLLEEVNRKMEILLIATPKETADKYLNLFEKMKLTPQALEVESQSVQRALLKPNESVSFLVADINDHKTNLVMIENGKLKFTSSIPLGGNQFTEALSKHTSLPFEKAEKIKQAAGLNNTPEYPNMKTSMLEVLKNLAAEIKNVLQFQTEHSATKTDRIVICGGGARLKSIDTNLQSEFSDLALAIQLAKPFNRVFVDPKLEFSEELALDYVTAIGLALRTEY